MKRLIFVTGRWSTILTVAFLKSRGDHSQYEDTLVHMSHVADKAYLDRFDKFCVGVWDFKEVKCINHSIYQNASPEGYTTGSLVEKPDAQREILLREQLGDVKFDEIVVPHLFSKTSRLFMEMYEGARAYCIEEGLNSYFRHHDKQNLGEKEKYFLSRLQGYVSFNFLGLQPLFDFDSHGVPIIVPPASLVKETIEQLDDHGFSIPYPENTHKVLFIGQIPRADMPAKSLYEHYIAAVSSLLLMGASVYFVKHPRDIGSLPSQLAEVFSGQKFYVLDADDVPAEKIAEKADWAAVVSYASSALITVQELYGVPGFTIDEYEPDELLPGEGDFLNGRIFCAVVTPSLGRLVRANETKFGFTEAVAHVHADFPADPARVKEIYARPKRKKTFEDYLAMSAPLLERRIQESPYNSALRAAAAIRDPRYLQAMKKASIALVLNPVAKVNHRAFRAVALRPLHIFRTPAPIPQKEFAQLAANKPLSARALFAHARALERQKDYMEALRFWVIALVTHPWNLSAYANLYRWYGARRLRRLRKSRNGAVFLREWDRAVRRLQARAKPSTLRASGLRVAALTYRDDKGYTGGPGGVLALQRAIVGGYAAGTAVDYLFRGKVSQTDLYADVISGATFALDVCESGKYSHYIVHDLGTAYGLALADKPYVIVWHMQGSFVTQYLNFGDDLSPAFIERLKEIERIVMERAKSVVFPSDGAREMYFSDEHCGSRRETVMVGETVYNTILPDSAAKRVEEPKAILPPYDGLTFTSVGTLTMAKGQDQVLDFLDIALPSIRQNVRWICIGDGVMREELLQKAETLVARHPNFTFSYLGKIPHADVMTVHRQSDVYVMLHRISIFDFATLEAMANGCAIMLSKIGGNLDFDKKENVIFQEDLPEGDFSVFEPSNIERLKALSRSVLNEHFSAVAFKSANIKMIEGLVHRQGVPQ